MQSPVKGAVVLTSLMQLSAICHWGAIFLGSGVVIEVTIMIAFSIATTIAAAIA
jgi:hypothetical protein